MLASASVNVFKGQRSTPHLVPQLEGVVPFEDFLEEPFLECGECPVGGPAAAPGFEVCAKRIEPDRNKHVRKRIVASSFGVSFVRSEDREALWGSVKEYCASMDGRIVLLKEYESIGK